MTVKKIRQKFINSTGESILNIPEYIKWLENRLVALDVYQLKKGQLWMCNRNLYMDNGDMSFLENHIYPEINSISLTNPLTLEDESGDDHIVGLSSYDEPNSISWEEHFEKI